MCRLAHVTCSACGKADTTGTRCPRGILSSRCYRTTWYVNDSAEPHLCRYCQPGGWTPTSPRIIAAAQAAVAEEEAAMEAEIERFAELAVVERAEIAEMRAQVRAERRARERAERLDRALAERRAEAKKKQSPKKKFRSWKAFHAHMDDETAEAAAAWLKGGAEVKGEKGAEEMGKGKEREGGRPGEEDGKSTGQ